MTYLNGTILLEKDKHRLFYTCNTLLISMSSLCLALDALKSGRRKFDDGDIINPDSPDGLPV